MGREKRTTLIYLGVILPQKDIESTQNIDLLMVVLVITGRLLQEVSYCQILRHLNLFFWAVF